MKTLNQKIEEALQRSEKATPGPWKTSIYRHYGQDAKKYAPSLLVVYDGTKYKTYATGSRFGVCRSVKTVIGQWPRDAAFIAKARQDVPNLAISLVRALFDLRHCEHDHSEAIKAIERFMGASSDLKPSPGKP